MAASLASSLVTGLVGVPQLPTVVAELCVASLATTAQLGTLGAAISYYCIAEEREELQVNINNRITIIVSSGVGFKYRGS